MKKIEVKFVNTNTTINTNARPTLYVYYTTLLGLKEGDILIAPTRGTYGIVEFVRYSDDNINKAIAHKVITQKVDTLGHQQAEAILVERNRIKQEMIARKSQLEEEAIFALLAEKDPTMQALLESYNSLMK